MTYEQLAQLILFTIRIDIRCRVIHFVSSAMRHVRFFRLTEDVHLKLSRRAIIVLTRRMGSLTRILLT